VELPVAVSGGGSATELWVPDWVGNDSAVMAGSDTGAAVEQNSNGAAAACGREVGLLIEFVLDDQNDLIGLVYM